MRVKEGALRGDLSRLLVLKPELPHAVMTPCVDVARHGQRDCVVTKVDLNVGLDFEDIAGAESTVRIMQALSARLDLSLSASLAGLEALKQTLIEGLSASSRSGHRH